MSDSVVRSHSKSYVTVNESQSPSLRYDLGKLYDDVAFVPASLIAVDWVDGVTNYKTISTIMW